MKEIVKSMTCYVNWYKSLVKVANDLTIFHFVMEHASPKRRKIDTPRPSQQAPTNFFALVPLLINEESAIKFCQEFKLLPKPTMCPNCDQPLDILISVRRRQHNFPHFRFQCNKNVCKKSGHNQVALRKGTWFSKSNLSIIRSVLLLFCFSKQFSIHLTIEECSIGYFHGNRHRLL
jgi:hypothetical protein